MEISGIGHNYAIFYATCAETDKYGNSRSIWLIQTPAPYQGGRDCQLQQESYAPDNGPHPENPPLKITRSRATSCHQADAGTLDLLDGAIFEVVGPNGDTIGSFSTVGGEVSVPNLEPGITQFMSVYRPNTIFSVMSPPGT